MARSARAGRINNSGTYLGREGMESSRTGINIQSWRIKAPNP
jgi:hypothetical protein